MIANCQVAASGLSIGARSVWPLGFELYKPRDWADDAARRVAVPIPKTMRFREEWRFTPGQVQPAWKAGFVMTAIVAEGDYGSTAAFCQRLERMGLRHAAAICWSTSLWTPGPRRSRSAAEITTEVPGVSWQHLTWAQGTKQPLAARFTPVRVRPLQGRGERWMLRERALETDERNYHLLSLEATAALNALVRLACLRRSNEQQYREANDKLGFDHSEGRAFQGWQHHVVLTANAFTFL